MPNLSNGPAAILPALDLRHDHAAERRHLFPSNLVLGVGLEARVAHSRHLQA